MTLLESIEVETRKPCRCTGCIRTMPKGSVVIKSTAVDAGEFSHSTWCKVCQLYWSRHMYSDDEIFDGQLRDFDPEGWEAIRIEVEEKGSGGVSTTAARSTSQRQRMS